MTEDPELARLIAAHPPRPDALLPILHAIQDALGYLPPQATAPIARHLNLGRAEVHGVISFYHHFRTTPPGRHVLHLCRAEACRAMGGADLEARARAALGIDFHETTTDGAVSLEPAYCLGACAASPAIRLGDEIIGRVDAARLDALLAEIRQERAAGETA
jgi:formate dehydrogenase subunit gamma